MFTSDVYLCLIVGGTVVTRGERPLRRHLGEITKPRRGRGCIARNFGRSLAITGSGGLARGAGGANALPPPPPHQRTSKRGGAKTAIGRQIPTSAISDLSDYNIASHLINSCSNTYYAYVVSLGTRQTTLSPPPPPHTNA